MPTFKCPECDCEIDHLIYSEESVTHGIYDIPSEEHETEETEPTGNGPDYCCPECNETIEIENVIRIEDNNEDRNREEHRRRILNSGIPQSNPFFLPPQNENNESRRDLPVPAAIDQNWRGSYSGYHNSHDTPKPTEILICPQCGCKTEATIEETIECHNCNKQFNRKTAKKIIQI